MEKVLCHNSISTTKIFCLQEPPISPRGSYAICVQVRAGLPFFFFTSSSSSSSSSSFFLSLHLPQSSTPWFWSKYRAIGHYPILPQRKPIETHLWKYLSLLWKANLWTVDNIFSAITWEVVRTPGRRRSLVVLKSNWVKMKIKATWGWAPFLIKKRDLRGSTPHVGLWRNQDSYTWCFFLVPLLLWTQENRCSGDS